MGFILILGQCRREGIVGDLGQGYLVGALKISKWKGVGNGTTRTPNEYSVYGKEKRTQARPK